MDGGPVSLPPGALGRLGSTRFRHRDAIFFLGFTGKHQVLAGSVDGDLRLWGADTGKELHRFPPPRDPQDNRRVGGSILLSGDGQTVARLAREELHLAEAATGKELLRFKLDQLVKDAQLKVFDLQFANHALSADGRLLVLGDDRGEFGPRVGVWKTATGGLLGTAALGDKERLQEVALADDGTTLAALSEAGTLALWDVARSKHLRTLALDPKRGAFNLLFLPGGKALVMLSGQADAAYAVDAVTGKELRQFPVKEPLRRLRLSADGKLLLGIGVRMVQVWDTATGKEVRHFAAAKSDPDWGAAALSPDGKTLAVAVGTFLRLFDLDTGKEKRTEAGHPEAVAALAFSPDGGQLLTATYHSAALLWDVAAARFLREFPFIPPKKDDKKQPDFLGLRLDDKLRVLRVAFAPDGKTAAGLVLGQPLQRWEAATGKPLPPWPNAPRAVASFAFAPNGKSLAIVGPGGVRLVQPMTGKELRTLIPAGKGKFNPDVEAEVHGVATFTPDGRTLLASTPQDHTLGLLIQGYETATWQRRLRVLATHALSPKEKEGILSLLLAGLDLHVLAQAVSPDGKHLATASYTGIKLWDARGGRAERHFGGLEVLPTTVIFSPDSRWLLAGRQDGGIRVWEAATGTVLHDLPAHESAVTALAFSPDGKRLASGSADTTALLWDWPMLRQQVLAAQRARPAELEPQWQALAGTDARKAYGALLALAAQPGPTVAFLKARLKPAAPEKVATPLDDPVPAGPLLQALRAVEVLERIGTAEARQLLEGLAAGAAGNRLTVEAAGALRRLKK